MKLKIIILITLVTIFTGCEIEDQVNPNSGVLENVLFGATNTDLGNLVTGALANMREQHDNYVTSSGTVARELYLFDADPRNRLDLVGLKNTPLDNSAFYSTRPWLERYKTIKNLNILLEALNSADVSVTVAQKEGYRGFANTLIAHQFLQLINYHNDNGIRIDVADPDNLGPIVTKSVAFAKISELLDEAITQLNDGEFAFALSAGFEGFDTPVTFATFNRSLAAKVELFTGNYGNALNELTASFMDLGGDLSVGPKMVFSTSGGDILNGLFKSPQQNGDQIVVNNSFMADAEPGDLRVANKTGLRDNPVTSSGFGGTHETRLYASSTSPIDIIRNEELILIYAEAKIGLGTGADLIDAVAALDIIRMSAGLNSLATDKPTVVGNAALLLDEMLHQRRYSFWGEGHRMFDLRRYDRLNVDYVVVDEIKDDKGKVIPQKVFTEFPIPSSE
jgi:starch-binding outer membrane protein, SusD/RagB family